jgi:hypothetical protein
MTQEHKCKKATFQKLSKVRRNLQKCARFERKLTKNVHFLAKNFRTFSVVDLRFIFWPFSLLTAALICALSARGRIADDRGLTTKATGFRIPGPRYEMRKTLYRLVGTAMPTALFYSIRKKDKKVQKYTVSTN